MKTSHKNFTDMDQVELNSGVHETCGPLISIIQRSASLSFQHSMKPEQARAMAKALLDCADELEPVDVLQVQMIEGHTEMVRALSGAVA